MCGGKKQQQAFDELKASLSDAEIVAYFDLKAETQVIADARPVGLGAVLVQNQEGVQQLFHMQVVVCQCGMKIFTNRKGSSCAGMDL